MNPAIDYKIRFSRKAFLISFICTISFFLSNSICLAESLYVTDSIKITLRRSPSTKSNILEMLPTGTKLYRLQSNQNWIKVRTPQGNEGWVLKRYTMTSKPQERLVEELRNQIQKLKREKGENASDFARIKNQNKSLRKDLNSTRHQLRVLQQKYKDLKSNAQDTLALRQNLQDTLNELDISKSRLNKLNSKYKELRSQESLQWFLYGAGIVIISLILGFFFGRLHRKKSSRYYF